MGLYTVETVLQKSKKIMCYYTVFALFYLYLKAISKYKPPGAYIRNGDLTDGFLRYEFEGAYFRNFAVPHVYLFF